MIISERAEFLLTPAPLVVPKNKNLPFYWTVSGRENNVTIYFRAIFVAATEIFNNNNKLLPNDI